jgi:hypothetical protein
MSRTSSVAAVQIVRMDMPARIVKPCATPGHCDCGPLSSKFASTGAGCPPGVRSWDVSVRRRAGRETWRLYRPSEIGFGHHLPCSRSADRLPVRFEPASHVAQIDAISIELGPFHYERLPQTPSLWISTGFTRQTSGQLKFETMRPLPAELTQRLDTREAVADRRSRTAIVLRMTRVRSRK